MPSSPLHPPLWREPNALAHIRALLAGQPQGAALAAFLPVVMRQGATAPLQRRAALANTLVAGFELTRGKPRLPRVTQSLPQSRLAAGLRRFVKNMTSPASELRTRKESARRCGR